MDSKIYVYTCNDTSSKRNTDVGLFWLSYFSEHTSSKGQDL